MPDFDPAAELSRLKSQTQTIRKKRYTKSRLDVFKGELLSLSRAGASVAELQRWLITKKIKVNWTTIRRWLDKNG